MKPFNQQIPFVIFCIVAYLLYLNLFYVASLPETNNPMTNYPAQQNNSLSASQNLSPSGQENATAYWNIIKDNTWVLVTIGVVFTVLNFIVGPGIGVRAVVRVWRWIKGAFLACKFKVTSGTYSETADLNQAIRNEFGPNYRLADWNDVKAIHSGDIQGWADSIGLKHGYDYFVSWKGQEWNGKDLVSGRNRHFLITRFDHEVERGCAIHDHKDNYFITLGSWHGIQKHALAVKTTERSYQSILPDGVAELKAPGPIATYTNHSLCFEIPGGWKVVKDTIEGNDTQIVLSDDHSEIRIDLLKYTDQVIDQLVTEHLKRKKTIPENAPYSPWRPIYALEPWTANGAIGYYYKNNLIKPVNNLDCFGSGISIKPDGVDQASIYESCEERPVEWLIAWTKPEYNEVIIGVHARFSGDYQQIPFEWRGSPKNYTMQQPLWLVLTTITIGDKLKVINH